MGRDGGVGLGRDGGVGMVRDGGIGMVRDGGIGMVRDEGERDGYGEGRNGWGEGVVFTHLGSSLPLSDHAC